MIHGIDHVVIAVPDPDEAAWHVQEELGLLATGGGRHDAMGTHNRLVWLGDSYLELIGVFDRSLAESSWIGLPAMRVLDGGGGLTTWAIATDELDIDLARLHAIGSILSEPVIGERRRPDGAVARWRFAAAPTLGPSEPPFLIEHDTTSAEWTRAERAERAEFRHPIGGLVWLEALELPVDDVNQTMMRFLRTAGLRFRPSLIGGGARESEVGAHAVRLRPAGHTPALPVINLAAGVGKARTVELLGCRWVVRAAA
jgi:Glyoxalase-like domain